MDHVQWSARPRLEEPVLVAAFEGWNDAGDAATTAARYLRDRWEARPFASIDAEDFYDFTTTRPQVRLTEDDAREVVWPVNDLYAASVAGSGPDVIVLLGTEPQLRWRTFCEQVVGVAHELGAGMVLTLGALLADVPHTRPTSVIGTASSQATIARYDMRRSRYQGPTGIVGVLQDQCTRHGLESASLWATVPAYVPGAPSPKAALALVERTSEILGTSLVTTDLEIAAASYERQVTQVVAGDEEMSEYVADLESRYEEGDELPTGEGLVEEVERFLRDHRND
jgi:proteasome assembly chaperone (PAC2) family protein